MNYNSSLTTFSIILLCLKSITINAVEMGSLDCLIEPETMIEMSSPVNGIVDKMFVDNSDIIKKGQILAKLESSIEQANLALARVKAKSNNEVTAKKISHKFAKKRMSRIGKLYKSKTASSHQMDEAKKEFAIAEHEYQQAINNKRIAELEYVKAKKELARRTIRSPINGVVVKRYVSPGELINERPLLKLAQINPLKIEVIVPSEMFGLISLGSKALVLPESQSSKSIKVTVTRVDRVIDASSGTFAVWLSLPNKNNEIPSGLKCKIRFNFKKK